MLIPIILILALSAYFFLGKRRNPKSNETFSKPAQYDAIVVGAGVCGITLSNTLANLGKKVLVIEKDISNSERFVGEVLQPAGCRMLRELGMGEGLEGIDAQTIKGYGVYMKNFKQALPYENDQTGRGYHHATFVKKLREIATKNKNITFVHGTVNKVLEDGDKIVGVNYTTKEQSIEEYAPLTFVCSGVSSIFRETLNQAEPVVASSFIALILKDVNTEILFPSFGNVLLEERPILMYPISSTEVRILVDYKGTVPSASNGDLQKFLLEDVIRLIPKNLHDVYTKAVHSSVKYMPNRSLNANPVQKHGVFLLGDTLNCRHPLTGGAQTVIFSDILILRDLFQNVDFKHYDAVQDAFYEFQERRKKVAATINILANALYAIFSAQEGMEDMKNAVLAYFHLGGVCVSGPMGFLSGLDPRPYYLLTHFFAVSFYGSLNILWNTWSLPTAASVVYNAGSLVLPLIANEKILF